MKNKRKTVISVVLSLILLLGAIVTVSAETIDTTSADEPYTTRYVNISSCNCNCYISGLRIYVSADMRAKSSQYLCIVIELQKLKSGAYETIETWSTSKTGTSISLYEDRLINLLATYRIKVTFIAGSESTTLFAYP